MSEQTKPALQKAVTSALPDGKEAYFFVPVLLWHRNGACYGVFGSANVALAWQRGASPGQAQHFYLTDDEGRRVTLEEPSGAPGHAYAILDALDS